MTLGLDILLLTVDRDLRMVRDRENVGYAMMAADLIELTAARRVQVVGRWTDWLRVIDARPAASRSSMPCWPRWAHSFPRARRLSPVDWMVKQPGRGAVDEGLALLQAQGAVGLYPRRVTSRLTLTEPVLLDQARQAEIRAGWTDSSPPGAPLACSTGRWLAWSIPAGCGFLVMSTGPPTGGTRTPRAGSGARTGPTRWRRRSGS